ncbi:MAG TPA: ATP-binding protein [Methylomirabilota bacterium]|nr:ATP-binding protein [Methylomirabilota bacterium]
MPDSNLSKQLHQRILLCSALGMLVVGAVVAVVSIAPLSSRLKSAQERNIMFDWQVRARVVEQYALRARQSARSVANRGRSREQLEAYSRGELDLPAVRRAVQEVVDDRLSFSTNTIGVVVLDRFTNVLAAAGVTSAPALWPVPRSEAVEPSLRGPMRLGTETVILAGAAITNSAGAMIGGAIVTYRLHSLLVQLRDNSTFERPEEVVVGDLNNPDLPVFLPLQLGRGGQDTKTMSLVRQALALAAQTSEPARLNTPEAQRSSLVFLCGRAPGTDWGVVLAVERSQIYGPINRLVFTVAGVVVLLIALGTAGMIKLLRPLTGRVILHTDELENRIYEKTAALNNELAERKRAEKSLRDSEALYHSLVDTLPISILRKDLEGRITFGNRGYCELTGRSLEELVGRTDWDLFPRELAEKYVSDDRKTIQTREVFEDIEEHVKPNGERLYVHVLKAPVLDSRGEVIGTQVIFWDVTARRVAEQTLARTAADLARSNRELELFAYVASHDLQEPLRMITSYTQLLQRRYQSKLDADADTFIQFAVDGAHRMQKLINDLLTYSRVGTRPKTFEPTDCNKMVQSALANLKLAIEESGTQVCCDVLPTLPADGVQLVQLFQNLIGNAIKFRGQEAPRIHISAHLRKVPEDPTLEEWQFTVKDNGIGIEPQFFERIFVIFQRLHTQQEYPGTGIGLAICKKIVERHGGRIWVESQPGEGSAFHFTLPNLARPTEVREAVPS